MKVSLFVFVAMAALAGVMASMAACRQKSAPDRVAGWRGDLDFLVAEARRVHAGPTRPAHSRAFTQAAADLSQRIPDLSDRRIMVEVQRLLAMLGDGHSIVYAMPIPRVSFAMLPVDLYLFSDGLFIIAGTGPAQELSGSRIVRFGARTTEEILAAMEPFVSRDNAMGLKAFAGLFLILPAFLEAWGAADNPDYVTLAVIDTAGQTREATLAAGPARRMRKKLFAPAGAPLPVPLYLRHTDKAYWLHSLAEHDALYFQFNQVADADTSLAAFASRLPDSLASTHADHMIIDVRHNNGGNNLLLQPLIEAISGFAAVSPKHRVYVLTSRGTFSAAQNFINRIERRIPTIIFAGEPSMSSPNFTGEDNPITLPFSGMMVSISNRYWQDSDANDRRPWIAPHLPVALSSQDWLNNRDPVLDAVLSAMALNRSKKGSGD
ncbi:MAG: hypothetical protein ACREOO_33100 [bacterium]